METIKLEQNNSALSSRYNIQRIRRTQEKEFNQEKASHDRKLKRLGIISWSIFLCFILFACTILLLIIDVWYKNGNLADTNVLTILITVLSTTLTTLVGVVIGSKDLD